MQGDWWQKGRELLDNMEGIFHYLAPEEAAMRENPDKRTTELLRQVFGAKYAIIPTCPWFL